MTDDLISRQAVLDKAWDVLYDEEYVQVVDVGDIQELELVEGRKLGKWVKNEHTFWTCSECGHVNKYNRVQYAYCPNCGAEMR